MAEGPDNQDGPEVTPEMCLAGAFVLDDALASQAWSSQEIAEAIYIAMFAQRVPLQSAG